MTNYERDHLNPNYNREPQYCECEDCNNTGLVYVNDSDVPEDKQLIKEPCTRCEGTGWLEC